MANSCLNTLGSMPGSSLVYKGSNGVVIETRDIVARRNKSGLYVHVRVNGKKVRLDWNARFNGFVQRGIL